MMTTRNNDHPEWGGTSVDPVSDSNEDPGSLGARKPLAVFDIDGVLADVRHRLPHVQARPKDWDAFFAAIGKDPVLPDGLAPVSYTHLRAHETRHDLVCRLLLEKKKQMQTR